jgi:hypothetical protein
MLSIVIRGNNVKWLEEKVKMNEETTEKELKALLQDLLIGAVLNNSEVQGINFTDYNDGAIILNIQARDTLSSTETWHSMLLPRTNVQMVQDRLASVSSVLSSQASEEEQAPPAIIAWLDETRESLLQGNVIQGNTSRPYILTAYRADGTSKPFRSLDAYSAEQDARTLWETNRWVRIEINGVVRYPLETEE